MEKPFQPNQMHCRLPGQFKVHEGAFLLAKQFNKGEKNDTQSASCPCSSLGKTHDVQTDYEGMWNCKTVVSNKATTPGGSAPLGAPIPSTG